MKYLFVFIYIFSVIVFSSDHNTSVQELPEGFIDKTHRNLSAKVKEWCVDIDFMVLDIYDYFNDNNESHPVENNTNIFLINDVNISQKNRASTSIEMPPFLETSLEDENMNCEIEKVSVLDKNISKISPIQSDSSTDNNTSVEFEDLNCSSIEVLENSQTLDKNNTKTQKEKQKKVYDIDEFFLTRILLEERDKSYVRLSFLQGINSLGQEEFKAKVRARVYLTRSRKKFKLFLEDLNEDNVENIGKSDNDAPASFGIEKKSTKRLGIRPRYSIGFRGIDPFTRARFTYETDFGSWRVKPIQTFQYSLEKEFSEITELYLDKDIHENILLRLVVDRGTQTDIPGMRYDGFMQLFYKTQEKEGLSLSLGFNGSTQYQQEVGSSALPVYEDHNKAYNYLFLFRYRKSIWKKWFFYEVSPGVNYHEMYDYRPNYNINFRIDLFFGHV